MRPRLYWLPLLQPMARLGVLATVDVQCVNPGRFTGRDPDQGSPGAREQIRDEVWIDRSVLEPLRTFQRRFVISTWKNGKARGCQLKRPNKQVSHIVCPSPENRSSRPMSSACK